MSKLKQTHHKTGIIVCTIHIVRTLAKRYFSGATLANFRLFDNFIYCSVGMHWYVLCGMHEMHRQPGFDRNHASDEAWYTKHNAAGFVVASDDFVVQDNVFP